VGYRVPSYGLFKTSLSPVYFYGIPRNVKATGLAMDVDRFAGTRVDKDGNVERRLAFNRARGARLSAMEHLVSEQMYSTEDAPAHGISAVKAIQLAAAEGQKIWTITQANLDQALASIELSDEVETDIRNSVYAGKEVTAHERPVNFFGSQSSGYIVLDPYSGAGAYLIEGGENGGNIFSTIKDILVWISWEFERPYFDFSKFGEKLLRIASFVGFSATAVSAFSDLKGPCGAVAAGVISGFIAYLNGFMSTFLLAVAFSFIGPLVVVALIVIFSVFMSMINEMLIAMATTGCAAARGR